MICGITYMLVPTGKQYGGRERYLFLGIIMSYLEKLFLVLLYLQTFEKKFLRMYVLKCDLVFWCTYSLCFFLLIIYMPCWFFDEKIEPEWKFICCLAASKLSPASLLLTVIPELVMLVVTRDYQLLCLFGSFRVLFQIMYSQKLDSDLLLLSLMFFWLYCSLR